MERWASMNKDLTFQYFDYVISRQNIKSAGDNTDNSKVNVRQIGGAGRIVTRAYAGYQPTSDDRAIFNHYSAEGTSADGDGVGKLESNLFYNEKFLYPLNVKNNARHYHNLRDAEMRQLYVPNELYSGANDVLPGDSASVHYNGRTQNGNLRVKQFYQGFRLNRGERVGTKGIELTMNCTNADGSDEGLANGDYLQIAYTEQLRYATMKDGHVEVYWS